MPSRAKDVACLSGQSRDCRSSFFASSIPPTSSQRICRSSFAEERDTDGGTRSRARSKSDLFTSRHCARREVVEASSLLQLPLPAAVPPPQPPSLVLPSAVTVDGLVDRFIAETNASRASAARSAAVYPVHDAAILLTQTSAEKGISRVSFWRRTPRRAAFGIGNATSLSNRPGLRSASSIAFGFSVVAVITTRGEPKPGTRVSSASCSPLPMFLRAFPTLSRSSPSSWSSASSS